MIMNRVFGNASNLGFKFSIGRQVLSRFGLQILVIKVERSRTDFTCGQLGLVCRWRTDIMKLVSSILGGIGLGTVAALFLLGACGGDKSSPPAGAGGSNAGAGGGNNGGTAGTDTSAGGNTSAGGTTGTTTGTSNPYSWNFYQDAEGWGTGIYPSTGTMTAVVSNVQNQPYCDGGCADILITFNGDASQAVNFMRYWSTTVDFTGKTITARIKIADDTGVISDIELHAQNGSPNYTWSTAATLTATSTPSLPSIISSTTAVTISTTITSTDAGTTPFDPTQVQGIGFNVTGKASATGTAHLYVDQVDVQ